ncbi:hypothetical protein McanCB49686_002836 [Microsporum canis]
MALATDDDLHKLNQDEREADVQLATQKEHEMGIMRAIKLYPKAIAWSLLFCMGVIMNGFDAQVIGNMFPVARFQRDFGYQFEGKWNISAAWQSGLSMGSPIGQVVGALLVSYPMEWFGRKRTFLACVMMTAGFIFIQFFARSLEVLIVGQLLGGLVLGTYTVIAPTYASEVCPVALRGILTSYVNLCFVIGQFLANGISAGTHNLDSHWAYSFPFALQWIWPAIILCTVPFAPESPWWLVRKERMEDAEKSLRRLASSKVDVKPTLAMIIETDRLEQHMQAGTTLLDCFKSVNVRRTEIAVGVYAIQVLIAGLSSDDAFSMGLGFLGVGFLGTVLSWFELAYFGRRTIYRNGLAMLALLQFIIGILDCVPNYEKRPSVIWAQVSMMVVWNFAYSLSVGPVCFVILCECSATKIRSKTIALATAVQAMLGIVMTVAIPYMINPDAANWRGKLGFFFGGLATVCFVWTFFRVPETKGRTYEELDIMFERNVPTRRFKGYKFD